jgi:hypothetical protein
MLKVRQPGERRQRLKLRTPAQIKVPQARQAGERRQDTYLKAPAESKLLQTRQPAEQRQVLQLFALAQVKVFQIRQVSQFLWQALELEESEGHPRRAKRKSLLDAPQCFNISVVLAFREGDPAGTIAQF